MVCLVSFDVDGAEGTGGTEVLAFTATYTTLFVYSRNEDCASVRSGVFHHLDSCRRTVSGTSSTMVSVRHGDAVLLNPDGVTDMHERFVFLLEGLNSACRADLRAAGTLGTAVTAFERHLRLHEPQGVGRGT